MLQIGSMGATICRSMGYGTPGQRLLSMHTQCGLGTKIQNYTSLSCSTTTLVSGNPKPRKNAWILLHMDVHLACCDKDRGAAMRICFIKYLANGGVRVKCPARGK
jgi:hypothetical protein